jgi:hypothetical protein
VVVAGPSNDAGRQSRISTNSPSTWPKARLQRGHRHSPWRSSPCRGSTQDSSDLVIVVKSMRHLTISTIAPIVHPDSIPVYPRTVDTYRIYDGTDELGIVGTVPPGVFDQEGRVLADGLRGPSRPGLARHRARDVTSQAPGLLTQPSQFHVRGLTTQLSNGCLAATGMRVPPC